MHAAAARPEAQAQPHDPWTISSIRTTVRAGETPSPVARRENSNPAQGFLGVAAAGAKSESELLKTIANDADNCSSERGVDKERGKGARFMFEWFLMSLSQAPHNLPVIKCGTRLTGQNKSNWVNRRWRGGEGQGGTR